MCALWRSSRSESWAKIEKARQAAFEATRAAQMDESEEEESESGSEDEAEIEGEEGDEVCGRAVGLGPLNSGLVVGADMKGRGNP